MPRSVMITTATLVALAALGGYWLGLRQVTLDATGVINAVAAIHVASNGGDVGDCFGWPGQGHVAFQVRCGGMLYSVDRLGQVAHVLEDGI